MLYTSSVHISIVSYEHDTGNPELAIARRARGAAILSLLLLLLRLLLSLPLLLLLLLS